MYERIIGEFLAVNNALVHVMEIRTIIIFKDGRCIQERYIFYAQTINLKNLYSQSDKLKFDGNNCELAEWFVV